MGISYHWSIICKITVFKICHIKPFISFGVEKMPEIIADISKGSYQDVLVVDKEINFIATVSRILGRI